MLGICPNCNIKLKEPPLSDRNINEVMLVIQYRSIIEAGKFLKSIDELGYCELCNAKKQDLESQKR